MEFITSQKNGKILIYNGFRYRRDKRHLKSTSWRCTYKGCKGRVITTSDVKARESTEHNHAPNIGQINAALVKNKIKKLAQTTTEKPRNIIQESTSQVLSAETAVHLPTYNAARLCIQRQRKHLQQNQTLNLSEIHFDNIKTNAGDNFIFWDSGSQDNHRIIMFGTNQNLQVLKEFRNWCIDGTFKVAPTLFYQLFTIHALIDEKALPMVYCFLSNKQTDSYKRVFEKILEIGNAVPDSILTDYEMAEMNAINAVFPNAEIVGCFFHLAQNLWRKIQQNRLSEIYKDDESVRTQCKSLLSLCFVPERDVQFSFEILTEDFPEQLKPIAEYWENNYVGKRLHNVSPKFPVKVWNMFQRISSDLPKCNNSVEAWHNSFQKAVDCHHPSPFKLLEHLIKEQHFTEIQIARYRAGFRKTENVNNKYFQQKNRLKVLVSEYAFRNVKEYLVSVSYNFSL